MSHGGEVAGAETPGNLCETPESAFLLVNHRASSNQEDRARCLQNFKEGVEHARGWK